MGRYVQNQRRCHLLYDLRFSSSSKEGDRIGERIFGEYHQCIEHLWNHKEPPESLLLQFLKSSCYSSHATDG